MDESMRKIGREISLKMATAMSFCLSLVGTVASGRFTPAGFLMSFFMSLAISIAIGMLIPMGKVGMMAIRAAKLKRGSLGARLLESFVSNVIYTPVITFAMILLAYNMVMKQSGGMAQISLGKMFIHSFLICFPLGFIIIFIIQPLLVKQTMKKYGVNKPD